MDNQLENKTENEMESVGFRFQGCGSVGQLGAQDQS